MPTSTASAPASTTARTTSHHSRPSPPVTYGTSSLRPAARRARRCASRSHHAHVELAEAFGDLGRVLVAPARQRDEHGRARRHRVAGLAREPADRVRGFERGHDAFGRGEQLEPVERFLVGGGVVLGAALRGEHRVLGTDAGIVEPGADRRRLEHLAVLVLQEQRAHAVHDAGHAAAHRRAVMTRSRGRGRRPRRRRAARRCR